MTDLAHMTKAAINALFATPKTALKLTKTSHADLVALFDATPATDALDADLRDARADETPPPKPEASHVVDLAAITTAEHLLLLDFAHCQNNATNGAPRKANIPSNLDTWVWLDERKVGNLTI